MSVQEARAFFLGKISTRMANSGKPLTGLVLEYWQALTPEDERLVDQLRKDRNQSRELDAIGKQFEVALQGAMEEDVARDIASIDLCKRALDGIKSLESVELQAIVFTAAGNVKALSEFNPRTTVLVYATVAVILLLGYWIGAHLFKWHLLR